MSVKMKASAKPLPAIQGATARERTLAHNLRLQILRRLRWWLPPGAAGERGKAAARTITDARFWIESRMDRPAIIAERARLWIEAERQAAANKRAAYQNAREKANETE